MTINFSDMNKERIRLGASAVFVCKNDVRLKIFCYPGLHTLVQGDTEVFRTHADNGLRKCKQQARKRVLPGHRRRLTWEQIELKT